MNSRIGSNVIAFTGEASARPPAGASTGDSSYRADLLPSGLLSVKDLAWRFGLKPAAIYGFIKTDPSFPYTNVGLKKKYMVDLTKFEIWIGQRTEREKCQTFGIPTAGELLARFKK
jgi:hypothetical protein